MGQIRIKRIFWNYIVNPAVFPVYCFHDLHDKHMCNHSKQAVTIVTTPDWHKLSTLPQYSCGLGSISDTRLIKTQKLWLQGQVLNCCLVSACQNKSNAYLLALIKTGILVSSGVNLRKRQELTYCFYHLCLFRVFCRELYILAPLCHFLRLSGVLKCSELHIFQILWVSTVKRESPNCTPIKINSAGFQQRAQHSYRVNHIISPQNSPRWKWGLGCELAYEWAAHQTQGWGSRAMF